MAAKAKFLAISYKCNISAKVYYDIAPAPGTFFWELRAFSGCLIDEGQRPSERCRRYKRHLKQLGIQEIDTHFLESHDSAKKRAKAANAPAAAEQLLPEAVAAEPPALPESGFAGDSSGVGSSSSSSAAAGAHAASFAGVPGPSPRTATPLPKALAHRKRQLPVTFGDVTVPEVSGSTLSILAILTVSAAVARDTSVRAAAGLCLETLVHYCMQGQADAEELVALCQQAWPKSQQRLTAAGAEPDPTSAATQALQRSRGRPLFLQICRALAAAGEQQAAAAAGHNAWAPMFGEWFACLCMKFNWGKPPSIQLEGPSLAEVLDMAVLKAKSRARRLPPELHAALAGAKAGAKEEAARKTGAALQSTASSDFCEHALRYYLPLLLESFPEARLSLTIDESRVGQEDTMLVAAWGSLAGTSAWLPLQAPVCGHPCFGASCRDTVQMDAIAAQVEHRHGSPLLQARTKVGTMQAIELNASHMQCR